MGIERARSAVQDADLVLFVVDPTSPPPEVAGEWKSLGSPTSKAMLVLHKSDLFPAPEARQECLRQWSTLLGVSEAVWVSSRTGDGLDGLSRALGRRASELTRVEAGEFILTRIEQQDAVHRAREALERAIATDSHELLAADLRAALEHLSFFIGKTPVEETLGRIFSQFCIGK